ISLDEHHRRLSEHTGRPVKGIRDSFGDISFVDDEMVRLIRQLKGTYKIGLLSNSGTEYIGRIIDKYDLAPLFDVMTISSEVGIIKPDPRIFQHVLGELGVAADEAVFIDDSRRNTKPASEFGIKAFLYEGEVGALKKELAEAGIKV
ncbi:MAG: HAD-IA family hydrolase, partial [Candidatus Saccharimonadales bacterium]